MVGVTVVVFRVIRDGTGHQVIQSIRPSVPFYHSPCPVSDPFTQAPTPDRGIRGQG